MAAGIRCCIALASETGKSSTWMDMKESNLECETKAI